MRHYELVLIFSPELSSEKQKKLLAEVKKIITDTRGKVDKVVEWGQRDLAFPLKKLSQGVYFLLDLEMEPAGGAKLEGKLRLEEEIIRYLLLRK